MDAGQDISEHGAGGMLKTIPGVTANKSRWKEKNDYHQRHQVWSFIKPTNDENKNSQRSRSFLIIDEVHS
jgi:hypothetical protein